MKVLTLREATERGLVEHLKKKLDELDVLPRTKNCIENRYGALLELWSIVELQEQDLRKDVRGFGQKAYEDLERALHELGLPLHSRLTDALKREIGQTIDGVTIHADDPHEDVEPTIGTAAPPGFSPSLDELQKKLEAANEAIEGVQREIAEAKATLARHEDRKRSLEFAIKNYTTIALALS